MNQAIDAILSMAVQLPILKRIGNQMGVDFDTIGRDGASKPDK